MSAAGRGAARREHDVYETPAWCVEAFLAACPLPRSGVWLEPAVGDGAIVQAVEEYAPGFGLRRWLACDVRTVAPGWGCDVRVASFLDVSDWPDRPHVIITNPPYSLALPFARRAVALVEPGGVVAMLLRLGFLASRERAEFLREHPPDLYPLSRRPSFTGRGTDATDYGWFVWRGRERRSHGAMHAPIGGAS